MTVSAIGLDIGKNVFHAVAVGRRGKELQRKKLRRKEVLAWFAQHERCLVGLESCAGSNYWAQQLEALGFEVKLMNPREVCRWRTGMKNDFNDAQACATAALQENVRAVAVRSVAQQDMQCLHGMRESAKNERTALVNQLRGYLLERGISVAKGIGHFRRQVPLIVEDAENALSDEFRQLLSEGYERVVELDQRVKGLERRISIAGQSNETVKRLREVPGIGPLCSTAIPAWAGDGSQYSNGRGFSANLGVVPKQYSTGGKVRLGRVSKHGNTYLRYLLINGARALLTRAGAKAKQGLALQRIEQWAVNLGARRAYNVAVVAIANRLARIVWVVLRGAQYDPAKA